MAIAGDVAQAREVAGPHRVGELVGRPGRLANRRQRFVALLVGELFFHLRQCCSDYVVMVNLRPDRLDGVEPDAMNQFEIAGTERRRVCAEVIRVGAAAVVIDDETDGERLGFLRRLPRLTHQPRLIGGRQRGGFADVDLRRLQPNHGRHDRFRRRRATARSSAAPVFPTCSASATTLVNKRRSDGVGAVARGAVFVGIHADDAHRHDHDIAIAGGFEGDGDVRQRVGIANRDQDVARPGIDLPSHQGARRQQLERVGGVERGGALARLRAKEKRRAHQQDRAGGDQRGRVAEHQCRQQTAECDRLRRATDRAGRPIRQSERSTVFDRCRAAGCSFAVERARRCETAA